MRTLLGAGHYGIGLMRFQTPLGPAWGHDGLVLGYWTQTAWFDRSGYEADDKCAWSPAPFIDGATGFAYQYEWSNAARGCVKTK